MTFFPDALGANLTLPNPYSPATPTGVGPRVGQAWTVRHDGVTVAVVVVAAVRDGYVLAWPVTVRTDNDACPCLPFDLPGCSNLIAWPHMEFGMDAGVLGMSVGEAASPALMSQIADAMSGGDLPPVLLTEEPTPALYPAEEAVAGQAWTLGDLIP